MNIILLVWTKFYNNSALQKVWGKKTDMLYERSVFGNDVCHSSPVYLKIGREKPGDSKGDGRNKED